MRDQVRNVERALLAALERGETLDPGALLFLLRCSATPGRDDLTDRVGRALAEALPDADRALTAAACAAWVTLLVDITRLADDDRVDAALMRLMTALEPHRTSPAIADAAAAIDATLLAASLPEYSSGAAQAVDQLEHLVGAHYRPGRPLGGFADHVQTASALLTAYGLSGRLPYSMLSEELMQTARRLPSPDAAAACAAARVLCRLAVLHADPRYRAVAVIAPDAHYDGDAAALLAGVAAAAASCAAVRGIYGVALLELESASSLP